MAEPKIGAKELQVRALRERRAERWEAVTKSAAVKKTGKKSKGRKTGKPRRDSR